MIEGVTVMQTTQHWLDVLEGSGMPYAAVNDIQGTLRHEHGMLSMTGRCFCMEDTLWHLSTLHTLESSCYSKREDRNNTLQLPPTCFSSLAYLLQNAHLQLTTFFLTVLARNMVTQVQHPACGDMKLVNTPVKYSESRPGIRTPPPLLGQHTDEVLQELLGMSEAQVGKLRGEGVVA